ncbi:MAG: phosphatidylglycerophosphatase A [Candidatus Babeliales bacterium]
MNKELVYNFYESVATLGNIGFVPWAPGTVASLVTIVLTWAWQSFFGINPAVLVLFFSSLFFIGWYAAGIVAVHYRSKDPSFIVIDEVVAMGLLSVVAGTDIFSSVIVFVLFRFFDIVKPFPIHLLDEKCKGGFGIMIDDLGAALATLAVFWGISFFYFFPGT